MLSSSSKAAKLAGELLSLLTDKLGHAGGTCIRVHLPDTGFNNPLTNLPGKIILNRELQRRVAERQEISVVHISLCQQTSKDKCNIVCGKLITVFTSKLIVNIVKKFGGGQDFIAHIKDNQFIVVTNGALADNLCLLSARCFDNLIWQARNKLDLGKIKWREGSCPYISITAINFQKGERVYVDNIINRVKKFKNSRKSACGSIFNRE